MELTSKILKVLETLVKLWKWNSMTHVQIYESQVKTHKIVIIKP
jgi:hypothetical protein